MTTYSIHFPTHFSFQKSFRLYSYKTCAQQKIFFSKCTMLFSHCTRFFCTLFKELKEKKMRKWFSVLFLVLSIWCLTCSWEKRLICHDIALADFSSASKFVMCCKVILWAARGIHKLQSIFFWIKFQKNISKWMITQMVSVIWQIFFCWINGKCAKMFVIYDGSPYWASIHPRQNFSREKSFLSSISCVLYHYHCHVDKKIEKKE